jgi:hypothetical protein
MKIAFKKFGLAACLFPILEVVLQLHNRSAWRVRPSCSRRELAMFVR